MRIFATIIFFLPLVCGLQAQNCTAAFSFGQTGLTIQFNDQSTVVAGDQIVSWFWDFDDGSTSTQQNPLHTFPEPDKWDVELTITTANGCTNTIRIRIETCILGVNFSVGACDASGNVPVSLTINDVYDNAREVDILVDGTIVPGSPFQLDAANPLNVNVSVTGNGLEHTVTILSTDIETCQNEIVFSVPDCGSDCFLGSIAAVPVGGQTHTVNVGGNFFAPTQTTITIGDLVQWLWIDGGHTTTSDATSGPDSWNSGLRGNGATYEFRPVNPGVHRYYCAPHGGPNGAGMAAQIVANCPAGGNFELAVTFNATQVDAAGFNLLLDGVVQPGSPFSYAAAGPQTVALSLPGDGQSHLITVQDVATPSCDIELNYQAPDCGAAPSCQLSLNATTTGGCDAANQVMVNLTISAINPGTAGYQLLLDGNALGTFPYAATGPTTQTISVTGDGQAHTFTVVDLADAACTATTTLTTTDCAIPCQLSNLTANAGGGTIHQVEVRDFDFLPAQLTIAAGDRVEWVWTGQVAHTATSDATSGPDSWDSGLLGNGATYLSPVLSAGVHGYYCIPHGAPGGVGMAATVTVQADCDNGMVAVNLSFASQGTGPTGYVVTVDGQPAGSFAYSGTGQESAAVLVPGDGQSHTLRVADADDATCTLTTTITTADCNAATCQLSNFSAAESGGCQGDQTVFVDLSFNGTGGAAAGYQLLLDGNALGTFPYAATGPTTQTISVAGDGQAHTFTVVDLADAACTATTTLTTTDCAIPCQLSNLTANAGGGTVHQVEVRDFDFLPAQLTIAAGDRVEWVWTGQVAHTATSDATSGPDSWDSGLLGNGATYLSPVLSAGVHGYYCIPHGAPGGVGMAATVTVQADCDNGMVAVNLSFASQGTGPTGYVVTVDGQPAGSFAYSGTGQESAAVLVPGDGQSHTLRVADADDATCTLTTTITTADCNAATCQLSNFSAAESGGCQGDQTVFVDLSFNDAGGAAAGYQLQLDGNALGTFPYAATGPTTQTISVAGDGQAHTFTVVDLADAACTATTTLTTTDCAIPCQLSNLTANAGGGTVHQVEVRDFDFLPAQLTIAAGDRVEWVWTGQVAHTATSDATSGPDSWDSGLLGNGATYLSPVLSAGVHGYYCIPHGAPGGVGMAATVTVQADCDNGMVAVNLSFTGQGTGPTGYVVTVDGQPAGSFAYSGTGQESAAVLVPGDGQSHTLRVADADDATCTLTTTITTADCNAATCQLSNFSAAESGGCQGDQTVFVDLSFNSTGGAAAGYQLLLDGNALGTFPYAATGPTTQTISVAGDGQAHTFTVVDLADAACTATTTLTTTDCAIPCTITGGSIVLVGENNLASRHLVEVKDFSFDPLTVTVFAGDTLEWFWTGQIPHTVTSDTTSGADNWDSGLLGNGARFTTVIDSTGQHPYYCIPHGASGGIGMAGNIEALAPPSTICDEAGNVNLRITFNAVGTNGNGFRIIQGASVLHAGTYSTNPNVVNLSVAGTGDLLNLRVEDIDNPACGLPLSVVLPDCRQPEETCKLSFSTTTGSCLADGRVPVTVSVSGLPSASAAYRLFLDNVPLPTGDIILSNTDTLYTFLTPALGQEVVLRLSGVGADTCSAADTLLLTDCGLDCAILELEVVENAGKHLVRVEDFRFSPAELTVVTGDTVVFRWTGQVPHTTTSDAIDGPNSWYSDLLGFGAEFTVIITEAGDHPYYCIPHGGPGGIGMAGLIRAVPNCSEAGAFSTSATFGVFGGAASGYRAFLDGALIQDSIAYDDPMGQNTFFFTLPGDGLNHQLTIQDMDNQICAATTLFMADDCSEPDPCYISDLHVEPTVPGLQVVEVRDFDFSPRDLEVNLGDTVRFVWTGQVPHTTTSDAATGRGTWDSGLLGQGAVFDLITDTTGTLPYYCIPHGGPNGIGMAGTITVREDCGIDGTRSFGLQFNASADRSAAYRVFVGQEEIAGGPFPYVAGASQQLDIRLPGNDSTYLITVQDAVDAACKDTLSLFVPTCAEGCAGLISDFSFVEESDSLAIRFTDQSTGSANSWLWGFGDGLVSREANPIHAYQAPGNYRVCLLVQDTLAGCNAVICKDIMVGTVAAQEARQVVNKLSLYPNPVLRTDRVLFSVENGPSGPVQGIKASLTGMSGRWLGQIRLQRNGDLLRVEANRLPPGIYTLLLTSERGIYAGRLVVQ